MKANLLSSFCLTLFLLACSPTAKSTAVSKIKNNYLITNVSIIPIHTNQLLTQQTVWIRNNKIQYIGDGNDLKTKGRPQRIDGTGKFLMPGLSDMHVHLPEENLDRFLRLNLLNGVTNLRSMRGAPEHLKLRKDIQEGTRLGPNLICASPPISHKMGFTETQIDSLFKQYQTAGYDLVKILSIQDLPTFQAIQTASQKHQIAIGGHTPRNIGIKNLLAAEDYSIEHLGGYLAALKDSEEFLDEMIEQTIRTNTFNCPTLDWYNLWQFSLEELQQRDGVAFVAELHPQWDSKRQKYTAATTAEERAQDQIDTRNQMAKKMKILKKLHDRGALLLISPDATGTYQVPGFCLLEEAKLYRDAGLSNFDILKIATWNAALYNGKEKQKGSVETGKEADLILLDKNPLDNIENLAAIHSVFVNGELLTRAHLLSKTQKSIPAPSK